MKATAFFFIALLSLTAPAFAAPQCYSQSDLQAEQLLRLHSELMVITVTCHQGSGGQDLVPAYTGFTKTNLHALHDAEQRLIHYYHNAYGGDGVERLDKLRTRLGNEYGQKIANLSAPIFCNMYRDKVLEFYRSNPTALEGEVQKMCVAETSYDQLCDK